jgi:hypothetical protein
VQPATEQNLDHLLVTRLGMVDLPPRLCGTYDELVGRTTPVEIGGVPVRVCALVEVLGRLQGRTRAKDVARARRYRELRGATVAEPAGLPWLIGQLDTPS